MCILKIICFGFYAINVSEKCEYMDTKCFSFMTEKHKRFCTNAKNGRKWMKTYTVYTVCAIAHLQANSMLEFNLNFE